MIPCAKCGAELIGSRKFCAACGHPAGDPRSPAASTGQAPAATGSAPASSPLPRIQYAPGPASQVNPFAQTAGPLSTPQVSTAPDYGPPPSVPATLVTTTPGVGGPSPVAGVAGLAASAPGAAALSPLASSSVTSERGAFERATTASPDSARAAAGALYQPSRPSQPSQPAGDADAVPRRSGPPGTQVIPTGAATSKERTQLLGAVPARSVPRPAVAAPPPTEPRAASSPPGAQALALPPAASAPSASPYGPAPSYAPGPSVAQAQPPGPAAWPAPDGWSQPAPLGPGQVVQTPQSMPSPLGQGGGAFAPFAPPPPYAAAPGYPPAAASYGYGFSYSPGARVQVTWSNGQRYPALVQQLSGTQCLVVFPDGQQHWVEMQYLAPG
jgi:hypothetical protein